MKTEQILMCIVALIIGMLLANMLKNICGCKKVVEGQASAVADLAKDHARDLAEAGGDEACEYGSGTIKQCICNSLGMGMEADSCVEGIFALGATIAEEGVATAIPFFGEINDAGATLVEAGEIADTAFQCGKSVKDVSAGEVSSIIKSCYL